MHILSQGTTATERRETWESQLRRRPHGLREEHLYQRTEVHEDRDLVCLIPTFGRCELDHSRPDRSAVHELPTSGGSVP